MFFCLPLPSPLFFHSFPFIPCFTPHQQFKMLMSRGYTARSRDTKDLRTQILKSVFTGFAIGICFLGKANISYPFYQVSDGGQLVPVSEVNTCVSLIFICIMYNLANNLQAISYLCEMDRIYRRELASFAYCASTYWVTQSILCLPMQFITHTLGMTIIYLLAEFPSDFEYYAYFYLITFLVNLASYYTALLLAATTRNGPHALAIFPLVLLFLSMFSGFSITVDQVPDGWSWAPYISYARWAYEGGVHAKYCSIFSRLRVKLLSLILLKVLTTIIYFS